MKFLRRWATRDCLQQVYELEEEVYLLKARIVALHELIAFQKREFREPIQAQVDRILSYSIKLMEKKE